MRKRLLGEITIWSIALAAVSGCSEPDPVDCGNAAAKQLLMSQFKKDELFFGSGRTRSFYCYDHRFECPPAQMNSKYLESLRTRGKNDLDQLWKCKNEPCLDEAGAKSDAFHSEVKRKRAEYEVALKNVSYEIATILTKSKDMHLGMVDCEALLRGTRPVGKRWRAKFLTPCKKPVRASCTSRSKSIEAISFLTRP